jgi:hypothetical protein
VTRPIPAGSAAMYTLRSFMNMTRHKHLKLDQSKIDRAKKLLGAKTEQDTIEQALDLVLGEEPILKAHRRVRAVGGFDTR